MVKIWLGLGTVSVIGYSKSFLTVGGRLIIQWLNFFFFGTLNFLCMEASK